MTDNDQIYKLFNFSLSLYSISKSKVYPLIAKGVKGFYDKIHFQLYVIAYLAHQKNEVGLGTKFVRLML